MLGFQYRGSLYRVSGSSQEALHTSGITGFTDSCTVFRNKAGTGTVLVYLSETGLAAFTPAPAHELFNRSVSLDDLFVRDRIEQTEEKLSGARSDTERVHIVERFLESQLREVQADRCIVEAVKQIYAAKGNIRIKELSTRLAISQSPFEKRFRRLLGTTPKKFASVVRFNAMLQEMDNTTKTLSDICYEYNYFDQAHIIKDFKRYTGTTPEMFRRNR